MQSTPQPELSALKEKMEKQIIGMMSLELPKLKKRAKKKGISEEAVEEAVAICDDEEDAKNVLIRLILKGPTAKALQEIPSPVRSRKQWQPEAVCKVCAGCIRPPGHEGPCMDGQCNEIFPPPPEPEDKHLQTVADEKARHKIVKEHVLRKVADQNAAEEEEARRQVAKEEAKRKAAEEEALRKAAEEEAKRKAAEEEEAARRAAEEEAKRKAAEEEALRKRAEEEAKRKAAEEEALRKAAEEEAKRKAAEEEKAARRAAEEEAQRQAEEELWQQRAAEAEEARRREEQDPWAILCCRRRRERRGPMGLLDREEQEKAEAQRKIKEEAERATMDQRCVDAFLKCVQPVGSRDPVRTPLKGSHLYTRHMRPCREAGTSVDVKDSNFTCLSNFLEFLQKEGLLYLKPGQSDPVVNRINTCACSLYTFKGYTPQPVSLTVSADAISLRPGGSSAGLTRWQ